MASKDPKGGLKTLLLLLAASVAVLILVFFVYDEGIRVTITKGKPVISKDSQVQKLETQSQSDDVGSIEKDLNSTNLNNIDDGTSQINQGLTNLSN
ncbi:MAG: hypothetical protein UT84_C0002G0037 [Candidatus Curtissbacteria bacterium GW2011_GWA1_40_16]|uniref:Uncharacterized protein n=1 Tax=Candidatus Curtissbacteria bacterium GW2011_GWA1_40_16 TaxID=1618405 RepID=A0A0G0RMT3_9BACT|nr:MAG: hypothetical protein UT84_C0002G0037 [Candidatus Curtissbacteria bacterium GW2011_GWA1_40_16]